MIRPFNGFDGENKQFNGYQPLVGYYREIIEYDYYDGPLCFSFLTELGDIYVAFAGEVHDVNGQQYILAQVTAEDLTAYHEQKLNFVELFDRGVKENGRYLSCYCGRYNEAREVVGELSEWRSDYSDKRQTVFNLEYLASEPKEAYIADEGTSSWADFDFVSEQLRIKKAITTACTQAKTPPSLAKNTAELVSQVSKLQSYITRYMTREVNVGEALGAPGNSMMNRIFTLAEQIGNDETASREVELDGQTVSTTTHKAPALKVGDVTGAPSGKPKP